MLLGEALIAKKLITQKQLDLALEEQQFSKEFLGTILVKRNFLKEEDLMKALSEQFNIPYVSLKHRYIDWDVAERFSSSLVIDHHCMPLEDDKEAVTMAIANPLDAKAVSKAEEETRGRFVRWVLASPDDLRDVVQRYRKRMAAKIRKSLE